MQAHATPARLQPDGHQAVRITVRAGFHPQAITARADLPLRLVFERQETEPCSERVVFSSPRLDRPLAPAGETTIVLPAQPPGEVRFTCAMGRYRGVIQLLPSGPSGRLDRLRSQARRLDAPLGTALALWVCSLPLIAVVSILALDPASTVLAAAFALLAWVAGCLWAFGELRRRGPEQR